MKWKTFLTLSLAGAALIGVVALVTTSEHEDAAGFYASYHQRSQRSGMTVDQRLGALDLALDLARTEGLPELQRAILSERVNLLLEMGAYGRSREDFRRLEELGDLDIGQRSARARMELLAGDLETAQALSTALVQSRPDDAQAHALKGRVEREFARVEEAGAQRSIDNELIDEVGRAASAHLRELCGREPQDVRRVAHMHELQALFGPRAEALTETVLAAADRASRGNSAAMQSYARSLRLEYRAEHLAAYAELLAGAGETERALNLCTLAWADAQTRSNLALSEFLLRELARLERWRFGNLVASDWIEKSGVGSVALYSDAARIAYGSLVNPDAEPIRLFNAGNRLGELLPIGVSRLPLLYTGTAFHRFGTRGNEELARFQLARYLADEEPEPFKGAHASAYRALAESARALGLQGDERGALEGAVGLDPDGRGEDWLRLSELERVSPHAGARLPDEYLARAITLLPDRAAELTLEWRQQGESQLKLIGFDEQAVRTMLAEGKRPELSVTPTPYELYRLAELSFEAKATARSQEFLRLLLAEIPGFPPALDLELAIQTQRGRPAEVVTVLLQRLERSGIDSRLRTQIAALPPEVLTGEVRRRLCLADPEGFGRLSLAENAREARKGHLALQALRAVPPELMTIQAQLEVAYLELEFGDPVAAFALMDPLAEQWMALPGAFELYSRIAIRIDDLNALEKQLRVFVRDVPLERGRLMSLAREWVARGANQPALLLCVTLDRAGKEFRGKELLLLQAACEAGLNRRDALALTLGRLEAVDTAGRAELLRLCAGQEGSDDEQWRTLADSARAAGWKPSPLLAAAFTRSLGSAVDTQALPEPWRMLLADGEDAQVRRFLEFAGVRGLFVCLAALEEPLIAPQAHALLGRVQASGENCWSGWLRAQLLLRGKFQAAARSGLEGVTRANPGFAPAWMDRMSLAGAQRSELRAQWAATQGAAPLPALEREILAADQALARGDAASALLSVDAALALDARSAEALELRARALGQSGSKSQAAAAWFALYTVRPPAAGDASLAAALEDCRGDKALLDPLQKLAPNDPRIVLALAEQDLTQAGQAPSFAVGRAFDRLDRFLASHPQGLDELAPGSAEAWARMLLRLDPARAQALLDRELDKDPGNVEAWGLMARVRAERGEIQPALRDIVTLQRMSPSAGLLMEYMRVRSLMDWTVDGVRGVTKRIASAPDAPKPAELLALESEALLHLGPAGLPALRELHAGDKALDATLAADARARLLWARLCSQETEDKATLELLAREWPGARDRGILGVAAGILRAARP